MLAPSGHSPIRKRATYAVWLVVFAVPAIELLMHHFVMRADVPYANYDDALQFVERAWGSHDAIVASPTWIEPLVRQAAGDRITLAMAGASDFDAYDRVWEVSIRGHDARGIDGRAVEEEHSFGQVHLRRYGALVNRQPVTLDLVEAFPSASVLWKHGDAAIDCARADYPGDLSGGLAMGPVLTSPRHTCGGSSVARTTLEDLELRPRRCVFQPPSGPDPIVTRYENIELANSIVLYGGLWWEHERWRRGTPVDVVVRVDGEEIARMHHEDGDGWARIEGLIPEARRGQRGRVEIEVSSENANERTFCWAESLRGPT